MIFRVAMGLAGRYNFRMSDFPCFDPRDSGQSVVDRSTWKPSKNAALLFAADAMAEGISADSINWEFVARMAQECDDMISRAVQKALDHFADDLRRAARMEF